MIEVTDEMEDAFENADGACCRCGDTRAGLAAVLAIVERDYVILPRGAQALCCAEHPDTPALWGTCPTCLADMPPGERT